MSTNQYSDHHNLDEHTHLDHGITRGFIIAIGLTAVTLIAELIGGFWTNSLALLSDAAHVFMDLFALILSLAAIRLAKYPASDTRTYGWHRAEILASLINGTTLLLIAFGILNEAWDRLLHPEAVKSKEMFIIATIGLIMNLIVASRLHGHSHDDLNVCFKPPICRENQLLRLGAVETEFQCRSFRRPPFRIGELLALCSPAII